MPELLHNDLLSLLRRIYQCYIFRTALILGKYRKNVARFLNQEEKQTGQQATSWAVG